jgi:hypothetical protein
LSHVLFAKWAGATTVVSVCAPRPGRSSSVIELTPLACCATRACESALRPEQLGVPAARFEEEGEVTAVAACTLTCDDSDDATADVPLLLVYALRRAGASLLRVRLLPPGGTGAAVHELRMSKLVISALCIEPFAVASAATLSVLAGTNDGTLLRWMPRGDRSSGNSCSAAPADSIRLRSAHICKVRGVSASENGVVFVWGETQAGGAALVSLPPPCEQAQTQTQAQASFGSAAPLASRRVVMLCTNSPVMHAMPVSHGALAAATSAGDIELFHASSGRHLGRVFTSASSGPFRRVHIAPAAAAGRGGALGLLSVTHSGMGVRVLLHAAELDTACCAGCAHSGCTSCTTATTPQITAATRVQRAPWADGVLPHALVHV